MSEKSSLDLLKQELIRTGIWSKDLAYDAITLGLDTSVMDELRAAQSQVDLSGVQSSVDELRRIIEVQAFAPALGEMLRSRRVVSSVLDSIPPVHFEPTIQYFKNARYVADELASYYRSVLIDMRSVGRLTTSFFPITELSFPTQMAQRFSDQDIEAIAFITVSASAISGEMGQKLLEDLDNAIWAGTLMARDAGEGRGIDPQSALPSQDSARLPRSSVGSSEVRLGEAVDDSRDKGSEVVQMICDQLESFRASEFGMECDEGVREVIHLSLEFEAPKGSESPAGTMPAISTKDGVTYIRIFQPLVEYRARRFMRSGSDQVLQETSSGSSEVNIESTQNAPKTQSRGDESFKMVPELCVHASWDIDANGTVLFATTESGANKQSVEYAIENGSYPKYVCFLLLLLEGHSGPGLTMKKATFELYPELLNNSTDPRETRRTLIGNLRSTRHYLQKKLRDAGICPAIVSDYWGGNDPTQDRPAYLHVARLIRLERKA